ncbi:MAG: hypothetical protein KAS92_03930 [Candidatus Omnitrophica bacterium]|nr:hypothetical protein [Candidatus Omnitrophota bacterium]
MSLFKKILPLCLIPFFLCGCGQKDFGPKHSHYALGISVRAPEEWQRNRLSPAEALSSMALKDGKGGMIIVTLNVENNFARQMEISSKLNYPVVEKGFLLFSKYKTKWLRSTEDRMSYLTYVVKAPEGRIFTIICVAPSINLVFYRSKFDLIAKSFRAF